MIVKCDCGATRTMSGATQSDNFTELTCTGHHPFKPSHRNEKCKTKKVIPSQRGASNVYFPVIKSAISIPPWINPLFNLIDMHLRDIEILEGYGVPDPEGNVYNILLDPRTKTTDALAASPSEPASLCDT